VPGRRSLTPRETEIAKLVAEGHSSQAIADVLVISVKTV
jgi:DNA-binding CsgD family transcriptional regulator